VPPSPAAADREHDLVYSTQSALDGAAVTKVWHEANGDWQLLDGDVTDDSAPVLVHRQHLVEADHTLADVLDIPAGSCATRDSPTAPWVRWPLGSA
jgi:hypothetical protein